MTILLVLVLVVVIWSDLPGVINFVPIQIVVVETWWNVHNSTCHVSNIDIDVHEPYQYTMSPS